MKELFNTLTRAAVEKFDADYAEARAQHLSKTMITMKEGRVEAAKQGIEDGVAIRVLVKGAWGFASVGSMNKEILLAAVVDSCSMAKAASQRIKDPIKLAPVSQVEDKIKAHPKKAPAEISMENKIKTVSLVSNAALNYDKRVKSCSVDYMDITGVDCFGNSEGSYIEQDKIFVWSRLTSSASQNGVLTFSREEMGSTAGYEMFDSNPPESIGVKLAKRAIDQLDAHPPKGGKFPVVLGPNVVGVFVHEAFGHLAEADIALAGGILKENMGQKIGSDLVTIYDDGTVPSAFGSFKYDDEGVPAQKTLLIKDGIVTGLMHNRETAIKFGMPPTGNARAEDFRVEPIIRMRNTFLASRDHTVDELVEGVKEGYFFKSFRGGQANLDGTFQVGIQEGYEIVKGEIAAPVRDASISGNTLETLLRVDAVGKDFELWPGRCGKGQTAFVCDGGPHIKVNEVVVGGSS